MFEGSFPPTGDFRCTTVPLYCMHKIIIPYLKQCHNPFAAFGLVSGLTYWGGRGGRARFINQIAIGIPKQIACMHACMMCQMYTGVAVKTFRHMALKRQTDI